MEKMAAPSDERVGLVLLERKVFRGVVESLVNRRNLGKLERIDKKDSLTSLLNQMLTHL